MRSARRLGPVIGAMRNFTPDEEEEEQAEDKIKADPADEREDDVAVGHHFAVAVARVENAVNDPRLAAELGGHPAERVGDVGKRKRQHQHPEQGAVGVELAAPALEGRAGHDEDEDRAQRDHEVERVVEELDVVGPQVGIIFVEPVHVALERAVGEEAQDAGNLDRVVEPAILHIGFPDHGDAGHLASDEFPLHRGKRDGLVGAHHLRLLVAGRKGDEQRGDKARKRAAAQEQRGLLLVSATQLVECADGCDDERAGDDGGNLVVGELNERPVIEHERAEVLDRQRAVRLLHVAGRVLHERIRDDDEIAREPAPQRDGHRGDEMINRAEPLLAEDEDAEEGAFQEEREHALHRQGLADHAPGNAGEARPVRAELEFHRDAGDDADGKINGEDFCPETSGAVVSLLAGAQRAPFPIDHEPRQTHRQLWE